MLANSGKDENNKYRNGKAGDQTGHEWEIIPFYKRPWDVMLRYEGLNCNEVQSLISQLAKEAANNNKIGYDQTNRTSFWEELEKVGYHPANILNPCESDCSAGAIAIVKAVGYLLDIEPIKKININGYSGNIESILKSCGFKSYTDSKYLSTSKYLYEGDILLYRGHHVAINLDTGDNVKLTFTQSSPSPLYTIGWHQEGDGRWWYADTTISYYKSCWKVINHHWYYFDKNGYIVTGLYEVDGKLYYFTEEGQLEGALKHTTSNGDLVEWYID